MAQIYVSSTFDDLNEFRRDVCTLLEHMGHEDVAFEYFGREDEIPLEKCLERVASADLYIGIFAWRYGFRPPGRDKSITELEYRKALRSGKKCFIFLLDEDTAWPRKMIDMSLPDAFKIEDLRRELRANNEVDLFNSKESLITLIANAVNRWEEDKGILVRNNEKTIEFKIKQYTDAINKKYCNLDLDSLAPPDKEDFLKIQLSRIFVEQNVREDPPPLELPKDVLLDIYKDWDPKKKYLPEGITIEDINRAKKSYYSKETQAVLDVICNSRNKYLVILGDPGSGKSTLMRYVVLSTLNINRNEKIQNWFNLYLPLLIELREFSGLISENKCYTFLDYFQYLKDTQGYNLTKEELKNYLKFNGKALVIFDGLDEVFDAELWEKINHMIVGFTIEYPRVNVIVTSRIVGYKRKILDDAGFNHFTIQDFEKKQVIEFLEKWFPLVVDESNVEIRKERITKALEESHSIRQLSGNPLLLTILAIISKHQELPKERWKLFEHATDVLIKHWEVNKHLKKSNIKMDSIDEEDKKELLMQIAYKMQLGSDKLIGNLIHKNDLQKEISSYLIERFYKNPDKAKKISRSLIKQLRMRNFIICHYGADYFGFVHRTFLEYFCARNIVEKFNNHELTEKELKEDYYLNYWDKPSWHEVLRLVCSMKEKFAADIIECLIQAYNPQRYSSTPPMNISLAVKCLGELRNPKAIGETSKNLLARVLKLFEMAHWTPDINKFLEEEIVPASKIVGSHWPFRDSFAEKFAKVRPYIRYSDGLFWDIRPSYIDWNLNAIWAEFVGAVGSDSELIYSYLIKNIHTNGKSKILSILTLGRCKPEIENMSLFINILTNDRDEDVRLAACQELVRLWPDNSEVIEYMKRIACKDSNQSIRVIAHRGLSKNILNDPEIASIMFKKARTDRSVSVRIAAVRELAKKWINNDIIQFIQTEVMSDFSADVRVAAVDELSKYLSKDERFKNFIRTSVVTDANGDVVVTGLCILSRNWSKEPKTLQLILRCTSEENNVKVRSNAIKELARGWPNNPETINVITNFAINDRSIEVRIAAIKELARNWPNNLETIRVLETGVRDTNWNIAAVSIQELAKGWPEDPDTITHIMQGIVNNRSEIRAIVTQELAKGWPEDSMTASIIRRMTEDESWDVRAIAIQELARGWPEDPDTLEIIRLKSNKDENKSVKIASIQELARNWHNDPGTLVNFMDIAKNDDEKSVRVVAMQEIVNGWPECSEVLDFLKSREENENDESIKRVAMNLRELYDV